MRTAGLALLLLVLPAGARAAVEVEAESVYRSYDVPVLSEEDVVLQPFSQALRLTAGERSENARIGFETYVRGIGDQTQRGPGFRDASRVYYAYLDLVYGRRHPFDLRIGRQTMTTGGDLVAFDGARLRYRGPLFVGFEVFGGTTVSGYGATVPQKIDEDGGATVAGGTTGGVQLFLTGVSETQARLGYRRVDRDGAIDREDVVADFAHRLGRFRFYGSGELSTLLLKLEEGTLGTSAWVGRGTFVDLEGFHYTPVFGASSIFNVFNIEPYDEVRLRVRTSLRWGRIGGYVRLGHAVYGGGESSENLSLGGAWQATERLRFNARTYFSTGYQGDRTGASAETHLSLLDGKRLSVILGGTWAMAENTLLTTNGGTYLSALGGLAYEVPDRAMISVLAEQFSDEFSSGEPRITASFRFKFGAGYARDKALDPSKRRVIP